MTTEPQTEVLNNARCVAALLKHKYHKGFELNHDPGLEYSLNDFFANGHYQKFCRESQVQDFMEKFKEVRKLAVSLVKKGKIRELVEAGKLAPKKNMIYGHIVKSIHESGWAKEVDRQKSLPERNQIYFFDFNVKKHETNNLLKILGNEFGNVNGHAYCDIYLERENGKYNLMGGKYIRVGECNPEINYGDKIKGFAYGRDAHCLETRLMANLIPRELTEEEAKDLRLWSSAHARI